MSMHRTLVLRVHGSAPMGDRYDPETQGISGSFVLLLSTRYQKLEYLRRHDWYPTVVSDCQVGAGIRVSFYVPMMHPSQLNSYLYSVLSELADEWEVCYKAADKLTDAARSYATGNQLKRFNIMGDLEILHKEVVDGDYSFFIPFIGEEFTIYVWHPFRHNNRNPEQGGLSRAAINELERINFNGQDLAVQGDGVCAICLEEFTVGTQLVSMPCSHLFDEFCIVPWFERNKSCPLCRQPVSD